MSDVHLKLLRTELERRGWAIEELHGDDRAVSATWRITRGRFRHAHIDFEGLDPSGVLPIAQAYACTLRETGRSLYLNRIGGDKHEARALWKQSATDFVSALDSRTEASPTGA